MSAVRQGVGSGMLAANEAVVAAHADGRGAAVAAQDDGPKAAVAAQDDGPEAAVALPPKGLAEKGMAADDVRLSTRWKIPMSKAAIAKAIERDCGVKETDVRKMLDSLAVIGLREVKRIGKFNVPELALLKVHKIAARKDRFFKKAGKEIRFKARPAREQVKAFAAAEIKDGFGNKFGIRSSDRRDVK